MTSFEYEPCVLELDGMVIRIPDYDVEFTAKSRVGLQQLRWIANSIPDCHVIAESLALASEYDGKRTLVGTLRRPSATVRTEVAEGLEDYLEYLEIERGRAEASLYEMELEPDGSTEPGLVTSARTSEEQPAWSCQHASSGRTRDDSQ